MIRKAIDKLSKDEDGFFLVVEESATYDMSYEKNAVLTLEAGRQLDEAVGVAKSCRQKNPDGKDYWEDWSADGHMPVALPVTAAGSGAKRLTGSFENTHIHGAIEQAMFGGDDQGERE